MTRFLFSFHAMATITVTISKGFVLTAPPSKSKISKVLRSTEQPAAVELNKTVDTTSSTTTTRNVKMPLSWDEMVRQVASAMKEAAAAGSTKQMVRVLLPRDSTSGDFGKYLESNDLINSDRSSSLGSSGITSIKLVPLDESWQGGIMQLYRSAAPTTAKILQALIAKTMQQYGGLPPRITEDRSVDESGMDGVGFFQTSDQSIQCWLQPMQDNVNDIIAQAKKQQNQKQGNNDGKDYITFLLNPQWRLVDDALDSASKQEGFLGGLASFLGGKGGALRQLKEAGFAPVYTLEGYVCRGTNVRLLQILDSPWTVYCERDDGESFIQVGQMPSNRRPTYQEVEQMLNDSNIGFKYTRDIGMSPKL